MGRLKAAESRQNILAMMVERVLSRGWGIDVIGTSKFQWRLNQSSRTSPTADLIKEIQA